MDQAKAANGPVVMRKCTPEHMPSTEWGPDCHVQWGGRGIVLSDTKQAYSTAYFEAFPDTGSGFIRGEGTTVSEAEEKALSKRRKELACSSHAWSRKGYSNGLCFCRNCGCSQSVMPAIIKLGDWKRPASPFCISDLLTPIDEWERKYRRQRNEWCDHDRDEILRMRVAGIDLPLEPSEKSEARHDAFMAAALNWARGPRAMAYVEAVEHQQKDKSVISRMFSTFDIKELKRQIAEIQAETDVTPSPCD